MTVEVVGRDEVSERDGDELITVAAFGRSEHGDGSAGVGRRAGPQAALAYDGRTATVPDFCKTLRRLCDSISTVSKVVCIETTNSPTGTTMPSSRSKRACCGNGSSSDPHRDRIGRGWSLTGVYWLCAPYTAGAENECVAQGDDPDRQYCASDLIAAPATGR